MDVVYILGTGSHWQNNELRYSLRSLEQYLEGLDRVVIVGECPGWLTNVVHIPAKDRHRCKERNIMEKVRLACMWEALSPRFLHLHDDHFCLAPTGPEVPNFASADLSTTIKRVKASNPYRLAVINTQAALLARRSTVFYFDIHVPMVYDKAQFPAIMDRFDWEVSGGYVVKSLYANSLGLDPVALHDVKFNQVVPLKGVVDALRGRAWWSLGPGGLGQDMKDLLAALYPKKSRFEL